MQEVDHLMVQETGEGYLVVADRVKQLLLILPSEGGLAGDHLVAEHAVRPPVHRETIALSLDDLRGGEGGREGGREGGTDMIISLGYPSLASARRCYVVCICNCKCKQLQLLYIQ